ncbi:MAG: MBL fold metallo-hydrolase [Candidatus Bilamarchaeaceae archaeon]
MKIKKILATLIFLFILVLTLLYLEQKQENEKPQENCGNLSIYIINVSQADSILIITPQNKTILIDSGSSITKNSSKAVVEFLKARGVKTVDIFIATHYHEDHIGGVPLIFKNFEVKQAYDNGNCGNYSSESQRKYVEYTKLINRKIVSKNEQLNIDNCINSSIIVPYATMGCQPSHKDTKLENENSIVVYIKYKNTSFLLAGDCEQKCETELVKRYNISANLLKINHHGSDTSSTEEFLSMANATYFVVSTNKDRSAELNYYHPRAAMLSRIYIHGARLGTFFRTDLNGNIAITSDGTKINVEADYLVDECELFSGYYSNNFYSYKPIEELKQKCANNLN